MFYLNLQEKLKQLRGEKKLSQKELANLIGYGQSTVANWETATTEPNIQQLLKLSDFFSVSIDYLVGNTDNRAVSKNPNLMEIYPNEREIIRKYRAMPPTEQRMICKMLDVKHYLDDMPLERNA